MLCRGIFNDGSPCTFNAARGAEYCFLHDPSPQGARRREKARIKGGVNRRKFVPRYIVPVPLNTLQDCDRLIQRTHDALLERKIDSVSALVALFAAWTKVCVIAGRDGLDIPSGAKEWGHKLECDAYSALMTIAEKSMPHVDRIEPGAIRAVDAIDERLAAHRRRKFLRTSRTRRAESNRTVMKTSASKSPTKDDSIAGWHAQQQRTRQLLCVPDLSARRGSIDESQRP